MKFRKKPVVIEAVQVTDDSIEDVLRWLNSGKAGFTLSLKGEFHINTLEGDMEVSPGDWVIKGVKGEFYPCKPDIFAATYDPVEE